jgi:hypothetical protein
VHEPESLDSTVTVHSDYEPGVSRGLPCNIIEDLYDGLAASLYHKLEIVASIEFDSYWSDQTPGAPAFLSQPGIEGDEHSFGKGHQASR